MWESELAWHFTAATLRDGRPIPCRGEWLVQDGYVRLCLSGLHASRRILDALRYAPGPRIHLVECADIVEEMPDKLVCHRRRILASLDEEDLLRDFARRCALDVIYLWDPPDMVRRYLETGDESLRAAAMDAAWAARDAVRNAAKDTAWAAARAAAWDAARAAARAAARDTAWEAARDAAWEAARAAAWKAARATVWDAVWDAAWEAAWKVARDAQNDTLESMVLTAMAEEGQL